MSLTDKYNTNFSPFDLLRFKKNHHPPPPSKPFDEALISRLKSLLPIPPSIPISWLTLAVDLLSRTLAAAAAAAAVSDPASDRSALASHLDAGVTLLDACNAISAHIDRHLRARLHLRYALDLLSSPALENVRRARESISQWRAIRQDSVADMIKSLAPPSSHPPRGKISGARRAIYAVEAVSSLVSAAVLVVLGGGEKGDLAGIRASGEFPWAEAFNEVVAAVSGNLPASAGEVEVVEAHVIPLVVLIDGEEDDKKKAEGLRSAVDATEKAIEDLTDGLERLSDAVSGLFRTALSIRNTAIQSFLIDQQKCK